nr:damage-inducible protein DinB [Vibrio anguillarum]
HTTVVDSLFISRILGEPEKYSGDNTVETPSLSELRRIINEHDSWLIDFTKSVSVDELKRNVIFRFIDGG